MSKVDIIIPVYNSEKFIGETIESIEKNNFSDFTIIIVDDGSTDNSSGIIENLNNKYSNICYYKKENGGVSSARNFGLEKSTSPYICFLDSDDLYSPDFLNKMYEKIKGSDADLCTCGYNRLVDGNTEVVKSAFTKKDFLTNYLITKNKLHISNFMVKRQVIFDNNIRFNETSSYGEDIEFMAKVIKYSKNIEIVPEYLSYYRIDSNRPTLSTFSLDKIKDDVEFSNRLLNDDNLHLSQGEKSAIYHKLAANIVNKLLTGISLCYDKKEIANLYEKYKPYIDKKTKAFGLRSMKLDFNIKKLKNKIGY